MSLVLTSSNWISGEQTKKRIPTIRKPLKPITTNETEFNSTETMYNDNLEDDMKEVNDRDSIVNEIIEKMSSIKTENDGEYLENFTPLSYPEDNEITEKTILPNDYTMNRRHITNTNFTADKARDNHSDFNRVYDVSTSKPYYSKSVGIDNDPKISNRLGYIIHLLEQQQNEKTDYVWEEYTLYILLGTFMIFIVDSFSRGGKYIR